MPISSPSFQPKSASTSDAQNIEITNLTVALSSTEYSHSLKNGLKTLIIKCRTTAKLQIAFVATETSTKYITIQSGASLELDGIAFTGKTLYVQANKPSVIVEIIECY